MRPVLTAWLARHGLPRWLAPDYFQLAVVATFVGSFIALALARRDGASRVHTARAIACAYLAALVGGYAFEAARALPMAVLSGHWHSVMHAGRAAYGGLLAAMAAATLYLRAHQQPLAPFFDRVAIGAGLTFAFVRTGCFLAGCDYGLPTATMLGVRFPPGSLAALDHARRGLVFSGSPSLPVHPTQLYEAGLGLLAAALAAIPIAGGRRRGEGFGMFLGCYSLGRFGIELLRGDRERGRWLALSTAQWVSVALVVGLAVWSLARRPATPS